MARVVRKVSNKATKGQKKDKGYIFRSKKFWIIVISVVVLLAAAGITIGIIVSNNNKKEDTVEVDDYFGQTQKFKETDVNFTKMTYQGVKLHTNPQENELFNDFTFVFATSLSTFYPVELKDSDGNDYMDSKHKGTFEVLKELQYEIDKYNNSDNPEYKLALYIVNTDTVDGNTSYNIYTDSSFMDKSNDSFLGPLFAVVDEDGLLSKVNGKSIYAQSFDEENAMISSIEQAINLVKYNNFEKIERFE